MQDPPSSRGVKLRSHGYAPIAQSAKSAVLLIGKSKGRYERAMWKVAGLEEPAAQAAKGGMGAEHGAGEVEEGGVDAYAAGGAFRHDGGAAADAEAAAIAAGNVRR